MSPFQQYIVVLVAMGLVFGVLLLGREPKKPPEPPLSPEDLEHLRMLARAMRDYRRQCYTRFHVEQRRKV